MGEKQKWWDRLEFVTRNITASMDATDADLRDLADRVAALERSISSDPVDQSAELHERIARVLITVAEGRAVYELTTADAAVMADALIRELDAELLDFGLWLSEELRGCKMNRIDLESCLTDWKESR